jgi:hypothetical protein
MKKNKLYNSAKKSCESQFGPASSIGKSKCIVKKYKEACRNASENRSDEYCVLPQSKPGGSRLEAWERRKFVYLTPYLQDHQTIACGLLHKAKGKACRPSVDVGSLSSIETILKDKKWLANWVGTNMKKLNRMSNYKDARKKDIIMYWSEGEYYDRIDKTKKTFKPIYNKTEHAFRRLLFKYDKNVANNFKERINCRRLRKSDKKICKNNETPIAQAEIDYNNPDDYYVLEENTCITREEYGKLVHKRNPLTRQEIKCV